MELEREQARTSAHALVSKIREILAAKPNLDWEARQMLLAAGELLLHYEPEDGQDEHKDD